MSRITETQILEIYKLYPRKRGKTPGIKKALKEIKTLEDLKKLEIAVCNYRTQCMEDETESRYMMHFSTFMGQWEDFVEMDSEGEMRKKTVLELLREG